MSSSALVTKLQTAVQHHQSGDVTAALGLYAEVLQSDPKNADAWHLSGLAAHQSGDDQQAESLIRQALEFAPHAAEFKTNLAAVLVHQQRSAEAETVCRDVLRCDSKHVGALSHLGSALRQQRRLDESLSVFQQAAQIEHNASSLCNLGAVQIDLGRFEDALLTLTTALEVAPDKPQIFLNLGSVYRHLGDREAASRMLDRAEELLPASCDVQVNKANLQLENGQVLEAIESSRKAVRLDAARPSAVSGLARALHQVGRWEDSLEAHRLAAQLDSDDQRYQSSYLYAVTLSPLLTAADVVRHHREWGRQIETATPEMSQQNSAVCNRVLRVGYVSPDLHDHATMRFLLPLLEAHDRDLFSLFFYSEAGKEDDITARVQKLASGWCRTRGMSDLALAERIQRDQIDILVDLAGHTEGNRLPVFARKPAPAQVSFLGYPGTTGLSRMDYFLTDAIRASDDASESFTEQPVLLPHGACCYQSAEATEISTLPLLKYGCVTLGSTHRPEKISPQTWKLWAAVMTALPQTRLLLFRDVLKSPTLREQLLMAADDAGIRRSRIDFGWALPHPHLQVYSEIDILLDVFPWGSGTIAYDGMWMGVPIPTIVGDRNGCRATASLMHHAGFPELVAASADEYVSVIADLVTDPERLVALRNQIRPAMQITVCDGNRFARDVEAAYRTMWDTCVARMNAARKELL